MPAIRFFSEAVVFNPSNKQQLRKWLAKAADAEGVIISELNFVFTSDERLLEINQQYLQHDTLTDIITFDNSDPGEGLAADVFISIPRARENAIKFGVDFDIEIRRLLIHGFLHLVGYSDKSRPSKKQMTKMEDHYLSLFPGRST